MNSTDWQGQRVLVTGAGGFIGSHLVEALLSMNAQVKALVRYNSRGDLGHLALLPPEKKEHVQIISGDLRDLPTLLAATRDIDLILHLGALIAIPYSYQHPADVVQTNIIGTLNILLAGRENKVKRIVHTSTSEVYGTALYAPINEDHPLQAQSPYSASKIGADKLVESFYCTYDLPVVTLRPFNTYGPRQSARAVIPTIITQALIQNNIHLGNLDARRDFTYISDTVNGFLCAATMPGIEGKTFNLGTGAEIRIEELVNEIVDILGQPVAIQVDSQRLRPEKSEVQRLISNNQLARQRLGWSPQVDLRSGLTKTIDWIAQNLNLYQPKQYTI